MKAIITVDVPEHQIGQEVSVYFKDTMCVKSVCTPLTEPNLVEHAKAIKDYCRQRDNIDDCCEDCQFHFYDGYKGKCIFNYGLYPNEWFNPNAESGNKGDKE